MKIFRFRIVIVLLLIFTIAIVMFSAISGFRPMDYQLEKYGISAFRQALKDPESAQFRNIKLVKSEQKGGLYKGGYVCGEFNAKNGFGAYGGFHRFYVHVGARTRFLIPLFGITHWESDMGFVKENGSLDEKISSLKSFIDRCAQP
ncbi:hypothetical protein RBI98_09375 [Citrobacter koseri]|uniref:hypothetical protein n=1 Tax=Citrobacter koseri TaxID=545 RepID=UPI0027C17E6B|nr:hypothetical protein [Citrobacter koseri]MDQ2324994.1 hypothetical protein [Citrobacter koseri]